MEGTRELIRAKRPLVHSRRKGKARSAPAAGNPAIEGIQNALSRYITARGGTLRIPEGDEARNDFNRETARAILNCYGHAYLVRLAESGGRGQPGRDVFIPYTGNRLEAFCCDFVVPEKDAPLERLLLCAPSSGRMDGRRFRAILSRVQRIGGVSLSWA